MVIRGTPREIDKYVLVDSKTSINLHENGFFPKYIDENGVYFVKSQEILEFIERGK